MPSFIAYQLTGVSPTLDVGYLLTALLLTLDLEYLLSASCCSSKAQPLLLTLDEGYLLTAALPDLQCGIAPLGPPAPSQPLLLGGVVAVSFHTHRKLVNLITLGPQPCLTQ